MAKNRFVIPVAVAVIIASGVIAEEIGLFSSNVTNVSETGGSDESALIRAAAECEMYAYEQAGIPVSADDPERKKYSIVKSTGIGINTPTNFPADNANASRSRAPSPANLIFWFVTNRHRRSTCPCKRKFSA